MKLIKKTRSCNGKLSVNFHFYQTDFRAPFRSENLICSKRTIHTNVIRYPRIAFDVIKIKLL